MRFLLPVGTKCLKRTLHKLIAFALSDVGVCAETIVIMNGRDLMASFTLIVRPVQEVLTFNDGLSKLLQPQFHQLFSGILIRQKNKTKHKG